jgi:hypothetical protein
VSESQQQGDLVDPLNIGSRPVVMGGRLALVHPGDEMPVGVVVGTEGDALVVDLETPTQAAERMTRDGART